MRHSRDGFFQLDLTTSDVYSHRSKNTLFWPMVRNSDQPPFLLTSSSLSSLRFPLSIKLLNIGVILEVRNIEQ